MKLEFRTAGRMDHYFFLKNTNITYRRYPKYTKCELLPFLVISLTNIAKYRRQEDRIEESKFGDTEEPLAFGDDRKIRRSA